MKRKIMVLIVIIMVIALQINALYADSFFEDDKKPIFEMIGREQGLQDLSISSIIQDKNGFIWFGTQGGLFQYNGKDSVAYRNNPYETKGLIHNLIQTMYYDENEHALWLGTYQGVSKLDIEEDQFTNFTVEDNKLSNNVVVAIAKDQQGAMWFGTMDGLNRLDEETGNFINYPVEGKVVRSLLLDSRGRLLVGTYEGLFIFDEVKSKLTKVELDYPSTYVMVVKEFETGTLTLGLWDGGVLELDLDLKVKKLDEFEDNRVYSLQKTSDDTIWVGTWGGGLFSKNNERIFHFPGNDVKGDIGHSIVYSLMVDQSGTLWIGTNGNGVYKTNPRKVNYLEYFNVPEDPNSLDAGKINTIFKDSKERLWIAVYNKGLNLVHPKSSEIVKYNTTNALERTMPNDQIMELLEFNGELLAASGKGIDRYDEAQDRFVPTDILPRDTITYALSIDSNNHLWVGTYLEGTYELDDKLNVLNHFSIESQNNKISDNLIYDILCDKSGNVWIGTNNGLNVYNTKTDHMKTYLKEEGNYSAIASNTVRSIFESSDGTIWIGMVGGGLSKYVAETDSFVSFTEDSGLIDNTVIAIKGSLDGRIWVATHNGMSILDPMTDAILNLTLSDGIGGYMFTGDGFVDDDGTLYFGGTHGITEFPPVTQIVSDENPPVYITDISIYNTPISQKNEIFNSHDFNFKAEENYISFEFNALDYETLSLIQYSYKLEGVDESWVESGSRNYASYSNLKSGQYKFYVRVKTIQGEYTEPVFVTFSIEKPWYNTGYAFAFYGFIIVFILYSLMKIRENKMISNKNQELASLNGKLEEAVSELETLTIKDPLTGIYNRRHFNMVLMDYLQLAKRSNSPISLLMIDVDDFKLINDEYGHVFGDYFLKAFATQIHDMVPRSTDFCARFGGDEFAVVLNETDLEGALYVANKIYDNVQEIKVDDHNQLITVKPSVCIGVCSLIPDKDMSMEAFVTKADEALYEAKRTGKNKIVTIE